MKLKVRSFSERRLACQHLQYLPFGEQFVEQRTTATYYTPYKFSAKEKDTETGYSYFGARYYDSDLSVWISTDPMAGKYPSMSAYMYCAGNPVMLVDLNGMEWDPSELTESQKGKWENSMKIACKNSSLFNKVFSHLKNSKTTYKIKVGATSDNVPAQFDSKTKTLTFRDEEAMASCNAYMEEIFHAYQSDNKSLYDSKKEFNYEFEAKIAKLFMQYQHCGFATTPGTEKMIEFMDEEYGQFNVPSSEDIKSEKFKTEYLKNAEYYRLYNNENNIGNENYRKKTEQLPQSLILLITN